ncbi:hypothetical protein CONPUDRAFT_139966 [Coniophora puteana RWD-64-598 SS2]|uniref:Uncharacterized protein n=1 Tax=Coniophora puteana (strain RWD-64-598) TaxID=741705 RepID=A0A5M3M9A8_CONPW|nr:uncharacterized protein CONPUDRAFT_139966 [Coniophora puteana RWD-64-598 SS2]EIW75444.1 hypothetical protein CONPUDRAFT_139966 [Coniophora puteana RWD-64-598 SS2]
MAAPISTTFIGCVASNTTIQTICCSELGSNITTANGTTGCPFNTVFQQCGADGSNAGNENWVQCSLKYDVTKTSISACKDCADNSENGAGGIGLPWQLLLLSLASIGAHAVIGL